MATSQAYQGGQLPYVLVGTNATAGDLMYLSTGTALSVKTHANGTGAANAFCGILEANTAAGAYGAINYSGVFKLGNLDTSKCEVGDLLYIGTASNSVGTEDHGTAIAMCVRQSASTEDITAILIPFWEARANG